MQGRFITLEGGEGAGKSTQAAMLAERLRELGIKVRMTREPGGSPGAEIIRHVLLSGAAKPFGADVEAILFAAARDDHVGNTIRPALERGEWVICDRFADSTRVYQGALGKVDARLYLQGDDRGQIDHDVGSRRISPESTRLPRREMVWNRSTSPSISTTMKLRSVSKPLAVSDELGEMSPPRSLADPPAVK